MKPEERVSMPRIVVVTTVATLLGLLAACSGSSAAARPTQAQVTTELKARVDGLLGAMPAGTSFEAEGPEYGGVPCDDNATGPTNATPVQIAVEYKIVTTRTPAPAQTYIDTATRYWQTSGWKTAESRLGMSGMDPAGYRFTVEKTASGASISGVAPCATPTQVMPATG